MQNFLAEEYGLADESASTAATALHNLQAELIDLFCAWIDPSYSRNSGKKPKPKIQEELKGESGHKKEKNVGDDISEALASLSIKKEGKRQSAPSVNEGITLVDKILGLKIDLEVRTWKSIINALHLNSEAQSSKFLEIVDFARRNGTATFNLLIACIADRKLSEHFKPEVLFEILLLGESSPERAEKFAKTIEDFAQNDNRSHSCEFREQCRQVLRQALEIARKGPAAKEFADLVKNCINDEPTDTQKFYNFKNLVNSLLPLLGHELPKSEDRGWNISKKFGLQLIKQAIEEYQSNKVNNEQFRERIWTVLAHQPALKNEAVKEMNTKIKGPKRDAETSYWENKENFSRAEFPDVNESNEKNANDEDKFHALPKDLVVQYINDEIGLNRIVNDLEREKEKCAPERDAVVTFDVEWSAYRQFAGNNRASILQLTTAEQVYVIDLIQPETDDYKRALIKLLSALFGDELVIKIGFQSEDLRILRLAFPSCIELYSPKKIVCISKVAAKIIQGAGKKTLSDLCATCLENKKPLNKAEQKSDWDRRPLRSSQLNYAALDAFCLMELFNYCALNLLMMELMVVRFKLMTLVIIDTV
uniref:3'-5' exonuclease domain-containing protein n=1 Tax=Plectus sambesii TaxID=2011161 RepID=A0A914X0Z9_9BILA